MQDYQEIKTQIADRKKVQMAKHFLNDNESHQNLDGLFISSASDLGVVRNGGRRGSRYAPEAILNVFKKMSKSSFSFTEN